MYECVYVCLCVYIYTHIDNKFNEDIMNLKQVFTFAYVSTEYNISIFLTIMYEVQHRIT